mmetsp:Transcript_14376/g.34694  ORF Transcript_14376/g.34694 Transcript_14376/m.34694 type:complete len:210 (+) Transcript_14376:119-748(+)
MACFGIFIFVTAFSLCSVPSLSFSPPHVTPYFGGRQISGLYCASDDEGNIARIKKAMASNEGGSPDFTQDEISNMDLLIVSLSKESDDDERRERLAGILDKELAGATDADETLLGAEIPRFAQLFQISLDNVGEKVQATAREIALEQQQNLSNIDGVNDSNNGNEGGDAVKRSKSPEELQLWALIDMMVQSKTRVKLHMGSLGSKGQFR